MESLTLNFIYPMAWPRDWPRMHAAARMPGGQFKCTPGRAIFDLRRELEYLDVTCSTLASHLPTTRSGIRLDMARNRLPDPGVVLTFLRHGTEHILARDAFDNPLANMRSIGLAVAALRTLERHGGDVILERAFAGFQALPPPAAGGRPRPWREMLGVETVNGPAAAVLAIAEHNFRQAAKKAHPDFGGSAQAMAALNAAIAEARAELGA
jgi:hypothetical protein